jgi:glycosyltransferase involved in cell wall biosynthesis
LHVCHVWDRFWPLEIGGLERYILWLSNYLSKNKDVNFSLITGRTKVLLVRKKIKKIENTSTLKVYRLGPSPVDLINGIFMYVFGSQPKIIEKMKFAGLCYEAARWNNIKSVDIFHIHGIWGDLEYINLGIYLSQRFRKPLVVTLHGGFVGGACQGGMPLDTPIVKNILENYVDAITTYSKEVLNRLEQMGLGEKSYHITNFVDTVHFAKHETSDPIDGYCNIRWKT